MKNEEWRVKNRFLQILTSLSSLFPEHERIQAGGEVRSTEPLLSTHPLTEPRKGDRFCVVLQGKEIPLDVRFVLCCKGRNAVGIRQW